MDKTITILTLSILLFSYALNAEEKNRFSTLITKEREDEEFAQM